MINSPTNNFQTTNLLLILILIICLLSQTQILLNQQFILTWSISNVNSSQLNLSLLIDPINTIFSWTVIFISTNIFFFSKFYILSENTNTRFNQIVIIFIISINLFIYSGDLIFILLGWDGLGVTSFLLVIYYQNQNSLGGGIITIITNRLGDIILILSLASLLNTASWSILLETWNISSTSLLILLLLGGITNSAQLPFSVWLPEAIAAPTPVSALVHSSTLVTAGIYLIIRINNLLLYNNLSTSILYVSTFTLISAGIWGSISNDTNNIVAFSTLSHLGIITLSLSGGFEILAYLHLLMHAIFNALLFICIGTDIIINLHNQNHISNLSTIFLHSINVAKNISLVSINAIPFMAGYISNDNIIETSILEENIEITLIIWLGGSLTTLYSIRLWNLSNLEFTINQTSSNYSYINSLPTLIMPTTLLSLASVTFGLNTINISLFDQPINLLSEHNSIPFIILIGAIIYLTPIINTSNIIFFLSSIILQNSSTNNIIIPTINISNNLINIVESGQSQWTLVFIISSTILNISQITLNQQSINPTSILLLILIWILIIYIY